MKKFEEVFFKTLEEGIGLPPDEIDLADDAAALPPTMDREGGEEDFNTLAPAGYAERYQRQVEEWKDRIDSFVDWFHGTGESFSSELEKISAKYPGVTKDVTKDIKSTASDLRALSEILIGIPRDIAKQELERAEKEPQLDRF